MDSLLNEIYSMKSTEIKECEKHLMLGGGTKGIPVMKRGKGVRVFDVDGKAYIDCTSQSWALYLGHANDEMNRILSEHMNNMTHMHQGVHTPVRYYLARLLSRIAPPGLNRVSFTVGGGPAIEAAMKICMKNTVDSRDFLCLYDSYHGTTLGVLGATWTSTRSSGKLMGGSRYLHLTKPFIRVPNPNCYRCFLGLKKESCGMECAKILELTIQKGVAGNPAGLILEPVQASGGQVILPAGYIKEARKICDRYSVPLIFDEIQTYCRIGQFFAADYFNVSPDIIVLGKALGGGLPLAGIIISDKLRGFEQDGEELHTFANNSLSQVAAIKLIKMMEDGILENTRNMGGYIRKGLESLQKIYPQMGDIRQAGLHIGVEFVKDPVTKEPAVEEASDIRKEMMKAGIILGMGGPCKQVLKIKPPLIINRQECDEVLDKLSETLKVVF